jgi:ribosome-associated heat shock protein Hsp15
MSPKASLRIDIWLWRARFFKTRSLAAKLCAAGTIRCERLGRSFRIEKPAQTITLQDRLIFVLGEQVIDLTIMALGERRGPAPEARTLYALNS